MTAISPLLSICIPTYNRSACLRECLESLLVSARGYEDRIEIVISDNASTDDTSDVVSEFQQRNPFIRYHRNESNVGSEPNRYIVVSLATGKYIWIFSDDDKVTEQAVAAIFKRIEAGYNLIICDFSVWSRDFSVRKMRRWLPMRRDREFSDHNALMKCFGLHIGFTSSVVIKREVFLIIPPSEYEPLMPYFPQLYSIYAGIAEDCHCAYVSDPIVCYRADNAVSPDYYKFFIVGYLIIFEALRSKGYTEDALRAAKRHILKRYVINNIVLRKSQADASLKDIARILRSYYRKDWLFWTVCIPLIYVPVPTFLVRLVVKIALAVRRVRNR